jgi:hypothetical protein
VEIDGSQLLLFQMIASAHLEPVGLCSFWGISLSQI